jgi:hypothetical protein
MARPPSSITTAIPSSFVKRDLKLSEDTGNGEAKLYIGRTDDLSSYNDFFGQWASSNIYKFDMDNLLGYLDAVRDEFGKTSKYKGVSTEMWHERVDKIGSWKHGWEINLVPYNDKSRVYIRSSGVAWILMREIAIPVISELEIRRETDPGGGGHVYRLLLGDSRGPSPKSKRPLPTADSPNEASADAPDERALGRDPETGFDVIARLGRFGPYVSLGRSDEVEGKPKTVSLLRSMDLETVTFEEAMRLLSLPRTVGQHPGDNEDITVLNGRYGPYLRKGDETRKLESEDQLFTLSLEEALAMLSEKPSMNELGDDPVSGNRIVLKLGRYGPYVSDGEHNASLRKGDAAETMTTERAAELLQMRRERDSAKKQKKRKQKKQKKDGPGFDIPDLFD